MSRNGTLEDALKSISDFNNYHQAATLREKKQRRAVVGGKAQNGSRGKKKKESSGESSEDLREKSKRKSSKEEKVRKKKRRKRMGSSREDSESTEEEDLVKGSRKKHKRKQGNGTDDSSSEDDRATRRERRKGRRAKEREERRRRKDRRKHARGRDASSSESESDDETGSQDARILSPGASSAAAIAATEKVLEAYAELRSELVQLLSTLDADQAVDVSSIPDTKLRSLLTNLFHALRLQKSPLGLYLLPETAPKTLETLAPVLTPDLEQTPVGPTQQNTVVPKPADPLASTPPSDLTQNHTPEVGAGPLERPPIGPSLLSRGHSDIGPATGNGLSESLKKSSDSDKPGGVNKLPGSDAPDGGTGLVRDEDPDRVEIGPAVGTPPAPKKRVIGPVAPPPEVLEAAAKLTEAEDELRTAYEDDDVLIGPPPPALVAEADNAPEKERFDEVNHILAPTTKDPYALLRVKAAAPANEIKKRYWKLSLLVHPDKCTHPQAQTAFTALNKAFKELEDPAKRAIVDARLAEIQRRAEFAEEMAARREAAQWRKLRGQSEPGDEVLLGAAPEEEEGRDTWMTELPPERQAGPAVPMQSTYFSSKERRGRGDTSAWTDNPQEKAKKAQQQYLEAYSQAMLGPSVEESQAAEKASATAQIIDSYNSKKRAQTLVEKHQEALLKKKQDKKKKNKEEPKQKEDWEGSHPWKPWDREKDLAVGKTVKLDRDSSATALASRFGAGRPGERKFL